MKSPMCVYSAISLSLPSRNAHLARQAWQEAVRLVGVVFFLDSSTHDLGQRGGISTASGDIHTDAAVDFGVVCGHRAQFLKEHQTKS